MDYAIKPRLSTALLVVAGMLLPVGAAMAQGGPTGGEMMGNGHWYGYGGGAWLPVLVVVLVGAVVFAVLRRRQ